MKIRKLKYVFAGGIVIVAVLGILNIKVTTRQGIDYDVRTISIPLYLKVIDFVDRHYNYGQLVRRIIGGTQEEEKKVMRIFSWTYSNIKKQPGELPVIDDHVWHIIVRGYGVADQFQDVFTTLCNFAGVEAFFMPVQERGGTKKVPLSFVKVNGKWRVFDVYRGSYFKNRAGALADIEELRAGQWVKAALAEKKQPR